MEIKNEFLNRYIFDNTEEIIRLRSTDVTVNSLKFDETKSSASATVLGTKMYNVEFYGFNTGMISSSCTCPFNYGMICKHEVAVAKEIDSQLNEPRNKLVPIIKREFVSTDQNKIDGIYQFSFDDIKYMNQNVLMRYSTISKYHDAFNLDVNEIVVNGKQILFKVEESYYSSIEKLVTITILDKKLEVKSACRCRNNKLCQHQIAALFYFHTNLQLLISSKEELNIIKNDLLNEFGFSLNDNKYDKYFDFKFTLDGLELIHKKQGIVKSNQILEFVKNSDTLFSEEQNILEELPELLIKPTSYKKKTGIAFVLSLNCNYNYNFHELVIIPITGNLNTDGSEITTKITEIDFHDYLRDDSLFNNKDTELLQKTYSLTEEYFSKKHFLQDKKKIHILKKLNEIIPFLKNELTYKNKEYRISKKFLEPIELKTNESDLVFTVTEEDDFYLTEAHVVLEGKKRKLRKKLHGNSFFFIESKNIFYLNKNIHFCKTLEFFRENPEIRTFKKDFEKFENALLLPLQEKYEVNYKNRKTKLEKADNSTFKKQIYLSNIEGFIIFKPVIEHQNQLLPLFSKKQFTKKENDASVLLKRDPVFEKEFESQIRDLHPNFENTTADFFFLSEDQFTDNTWFIEAFEVLKELDIEVFGFNKLNLKYNQHKPSISINIRSGIDWFDVNIEVAFGDQIVSLRELKKNVINQDKYIRLKDGSIGILPEEWLEKYLHLFRAGDVKKDSIGVSKYQLSVVDTLYEDYETETNLFEEHIKIKEKIASFESIENLSVPRGIKAKLRPYQKEGLKWLNFLDDFKLGGCLADDMGLGKTLQIITFLKHLKTKTKSKKTHLVVVPTSLIFNWKEEVLKFCPSLKIHTLTGVGRTKSTKEFDKVDLVLSTYGIVLNDIEYLKEYEFNYVILDESQAIKNPVSKRFKAVRLIKAENRLVLTGTPIENNTFDLYAQMTFVNPGLLGGINHFKNEYSTAIDKNKDKVVAKELKNLIDPFLMRRSKEQVATELPTKTEQFLYCTMGTEQRKLYEAYKNKYKDFLLGKIEDNGLGKSKMYVLEGLTKLRQICDTPQLLSDEEEYSKESVKIDELIKHITEKTNDHKILVFSQFVKMLGHIKTRLNALNISYEYLDGKTRKRQEKVDNFQNNDNVRVFLISLKAGGTGLNLTAADYVYIVDPWWNPAVEAQAIDRCYRIGQNKKVMAYKMICKDTIEEKIVKHQLNKKQVSDDLIQTEDSFVKSLSKESVADLFG